MPRQLTLAAGLILCIWTGGASGQYFETGSLVSPGRNFQTSNSEPSSTPYVAPHQVKAVNQLPVQLTPVPVEAMPQPVDAVPMHMVPEPAPPESPDPPPPHDPNHTLQRAGNPQIVAWYAQPSDTGSYIGYYVGGGAACRGEPRNINEGTWGWDYQGWLFPRRVALDWWHGRRYQGGIGHYRTVFKPSFQSPSTP
jgi:hypothetical protein